VRISPQLATVGASALILVAIAWALASENGSGQGSAGAVDGERYNTLIPSEKGALEPCAVCHRIDADGPESSGPALWGIDGADKASSPWFGYSPALAAAAGSWSVADIDAYLADPVGYLPGTSKTLSQVRDADERRRIIDALQKLK
jgi:cytochrome c2